MDSPLRDHLRKYLALTAEEHAQQLSKIALLYQPFAPTASISRVLRQFTWTILLSLISVAITQQTNR